MIDDKNAHKEAPEAKDEIECCELYGEYCYPCPPQEEPEVSTHQ